MVLDANLVSGDELCQKLGFSPSWIGRLTGLKQTAFFTENEISLQPRLK